MRPRRHPGAAVLAFGRATGPPSPALLRRNPDDSFDYGLGLLIAGLHERLSIGSAPAA
jgi:hypothetical protein